MQREGRQRFRRHALKGARPGRRRWRQADGKGMGCTTLASKAGRGGWGVTINEADATQAG